MSLKMSYITSSLSPYRSDNVWKEFAGILKEDYEWVYSSLKDRGLIFPIAFVILMSLSLLKAIVFVLEDLRKPKKEGKKNNL